MIASSLFLQDTVSYIRAVSFFRHRILLYLLIRFWGRTLDLISRFLKLRFLVYWLATQPASKFAVSLPELATRFSLSNT
jgi:hypothetical protein